jgi:glyoxylase-like metal-dependent hydrolase (beta-lactamase superfamily II)
MKIADGIEMLEVEGVFLGQPCKVYPSIIVDGDTTILVDAGYPGVHPQIIEAMKRAGIPAQKLNKVILTHQDIDHIGGLPALLEDIPQHVDVLAHEEEKATIQGERKPNKLELLERSLDTASEETRWIYEQLQRAYQKCHIQVDQMLKDGEELPYLGGVVVIHTPGHTMGHICLYLRKFKILIAGDALVVEDNQIKLCPEYLNYDKALFAQSFKKVTHYEIERVICYHGGFIKSNFHEEFEPV